MKKVVEIIWFWLLPLTGIYWLIAKTGSVEANSYFYYRVLFPALMMYLVVGSGAGYLKLWQFKTAYSISGVLPQIGIIYTVMASGLFEGFTQIMAADSPWLIPAMTVGGGLIGTLYDIPLLRYGLLKTRHQGKTATATAMKYGPIFFSFVGFIVGSGYLLGGWLYLQWGWAKAALLMAVTCSLPFLMFFYSVSRKNRLRKAA
ncbi:MAG: hypothetical protein ACLFUB_13185 [Cyclobacteriaceae bacterium]